MTDEGPESRRRLDVALRDTRPMRHLAVRRSRQIEEQLRAAWLGLGLGVRVRGVRVRVRVMIRFRVRVRVRVSPRRGSSD